MTQETQEYYCQECGESLADEDTQAWDAWDDCPTEFCTICSNCGALQD